MAASPDAGTSVSYGSRARPMATNSAFADGQDPRDDPYPDQNYLGYLIRQGRFEFARRDMRDWLREAIYWQEQDIPHPEHVEFEPVHTGYATETIQRLMGIFGEFPQVLVGETALSDLKIGKAQKVQDFVNYLWPALMHDNRRDTWDLIVEDMLRFGRAYDKLEYDPYEYSTKNPRYPRQGKVLQAERGEDGLYSYKSTDESERDFLRRKKEFDVFTRLPMLWRHLPARGCYAWYDDQGGIAEFLNVEEKRIRAVAQRYPNIPSLQRQMETVGLSSVSHVIQAEYWNPSWHAIWVSQGYANQTYDERTWEGTTLLNRIMTADVAKIEQNIYGVVPVTETPGLLSTNKNPARMHLACLDFMLPIVAYLDQLVSQKASAVRMWAWPTPFLKNLGINGTVLAQSPVGPEGRPIPIEIEPGKMLTLLPGEDIGWVVVPNNGAGADELIQYIEKRANALGFSSAVFDSEALQSNGYLYNSVVNALRSRFGQIPKHVKRSHEDRVELALRIVGLHGESLYVRQPGDGATTVGSWFTLAPDDIKGHHYTMDVKYEDKLPTDEASRLAMAVQATTPVGDSGPIMDMDTARAKYVSDPDPTKTGQRILIQEYKATVGKQFLMQRAVQQATSKMQQGEMMQSGDVPNAGLPPALQAVLGGPGDVTGQAGSPAGGTPPAPGAAMAGNGATLGAPTSMGGVPGAPAAVVQPGLGRSLTPPPPSQGPGFVPPKKASRPPGRPAGQSRTPPRQKTARKP